MSGAEPCVGPKMPGPVWDSRPEATIRESFRLAAARSETSSACACWVTTTQKPSGAFIRRGSASLSESRSTSTPGWRSASHATNVLHVGPSPTAATFALRERARSNARRTTNGSIWSSSGLTTAMSPSGSRTRWTRQVRSSSVLTPSSAGSFVSATRTASARRQAARVSAGSGWPQRLTASPANGTCTSSTRKRCRRPASASARLASAISSGPMPSPLRQATVNFF